jgi:hypothetical protein
LHAQAHACRRAVLAGRPEPPRCDLTKKHVSRGAQSAKGQPAHRLVIRAAEDFVAAAHQRAHGAGVPRQGGYAGQRVRIPHLRGATGGWGG